MLRSFFENFLVNFVRKIVVCSNEVSSADFLYNTIAAHSTRMPKKQHIETGITYL